jgi:hypothetical protein
MQSSKLLLCALLAYATVAHAGLLSEPFDNIATLPGSGWVEINNSTTGGTTGWFQGNTGVFASQAGATDSYIAANFNNAGFGGNISNWLLLPVLTLNNGDILSFYTRTETGPVPGDNLEVRLSTNGGSTNVGATTTSLGDFTTLLTSITDPYPEAWTQYNVVVSGLGGPTAARLGFRYVVTGTDVNGDYIGIDTVNVSSGVPEPGTLLMLGSGIALLAIHRFGVGRFGARRLRARA